MGRLRVFLAFVAIVLALAVGLCVFCWIVSTGDVGYSLVTVRRVSVLGFPIPVPIYTFNILGAIAILLSTEIAEIYLVLQIKLLIPIVVAAFIWLLISSINGRIMRVIGNKKTTLHGSSRWATTKEMEKRGLITEEASGMVLGETYNAVFKKEPEPLPQRRKGESKADFQSRQLKWSNSLVDVLKKPGDIVTHTQNAHTLIVGSTRSGKGVSCIIPTEFQWRESIIILDPKAEGWDISSNFRSKFSYTFKFQPENPRESICYNPLLSIRRGNYTIPDIQNLCSIIIPVNSQAKDPYWDNEARNLLSTVIGYVIYCEKPENKTFKEVYSIFSQPIPNEIKEQLRELQGEDSQGEDESALKQRLRWYALNAARYIENMKNSIMPADLEEKFNTRFTLNPDDRKKVEAQSSKYMTQADLKNLQRISLDLDYFAGIESKQLTSVMSTMMSNLIVIADPNVQEVTSRSDFCMEDFINGIKDEKTGKRHPLSLYLCVSLSSIMRLTPLIKIFYEQAITLLTRDNDLQKRAYRLLLVFDEFRQMGKMEIVERALALSAGYGILCTVVIQSYDQLKVLYQSESVFVDNFAYQVILKVNDLSTCERISKTLGQATMKHTKIDTSGDMGQITHRHESLNVQELGRSLMTAEEVRTMPDDDCLIIVSGEYPYKAKKIRYYIDDRFRKKYIGKNGKILPPPDLVDNYPHQADSYDIKKKVCLGGIDYEGWNLLSGYKDVVSSELKADESVMDLKADNETLADFIIMPEASEIESMNEIDILEHPEEVIKRAEFIASGNMDTMARIKAYVYSSYNQEVGNAEEN